MTWIKRDPSPEHGTHAVCRQPQKIGESKMVAYSDGNLATGSLYSAILTSCGSPLFITVLEAQEDQWCHGDKIGEQLLSTIQLTDDCHALAARCPKDATLY